MTDDALKRFIAEKVGEGISLSHIQDLLKEKNVKITFMELRLLASEIEEDLWKDQEAKAEPEPAKENKDETLEKTAPSASPEAESPADGKLRGTTTVEVSPIVRPGAVMSGSVKFGSGVTADWFLDQSGRLGLEKASGQPDQQDVQEFQQELQRKLGGV